MPILRWRLRKTTLVEIVHLGTVDLPTLGRHKNQQNAHSFYPHETVSPPPLSLDTCKSFISTDVALNLMCMKPHKIYSETSFSTIAVMSPLSNIIYIVVFKCILKKLF